MFEIERRIGESFIGIVSDVRFEHEQSLEVDNNLVIINRLIDNQKMIYSLPLDWNQSLHLGDQVKVTPTWKHFTNKGVIKEFIISLDPD